jgi:hemolysin III
MDKVYTPAEEIANSITHGIGMILSIIGMIILIILASLKGDAWHIVSFSIFGGCLMLLYLASTLYHSIPDPDTKRLFKIIDHSAIYLLIAGTYTPYLLLNLRGAWGWTLFGIIWTLALSGILLKSYYIGRFRKTSVMLYIAMGWLCVIVFDQLIEKLDNLSLVLLISGGIAYTSGVIFYAWKKLPFNHAIWHMFVLTGSICHYFSVLSILG